MRVITPDTRGVRLLAMCHVSKRHVLLGDLVSWLNGIEGGGMEVMEDKRPLLKLLTRTAVELTSKNRREDFKADEANAVATKGKPSLRA